MQKVFQINLSNVLFQFEPVILQLKYFFTQHQWHGVVYLSSIQVFSSSAVHLSASSFNEFHNWVKAFMQSHPCFRCQIFGSALTILIFPILLGFNRNTEKELLLKKQFSLNLFSTLYSNFQFMNEYGVNLVSAFIASIYIATDTWKFKKL